MSEHDESSVELPPSSLSHKELRMLCLDNDLSISGKKSINYLSDRNNEINELKVILSSNKGALDSVRNLKNENWCKIDLNYLGFCGFLGFGATASRPLQKDKSILRHFPFFNFPFTTFQFSKFFTIVCQDFYLNKPDRRHWPQGL